MLLVRSKLSMDAADSARDGSGLDGVCHIGTPPSEEEAGEVPEELLGDCDARVRRQSIVGKGGCLGLVATSSIPAKTPAVSSQAVVLGATRRARLDVLLEHAASGSDERLRVVLVVLQRLAHVEGICAAELTPSLLEALSQKYSRGFRQSCMLFAGALGLADGAEAEELACFTALVRRLMDTLGTNDHGKGLWIEAAFANHSCNPNARYVYSGNELQVVTWRPISEGEEIVVSYLGKKLTRTARRIAIKRGWGFDCTCSLCESGG